jgi:hypothetical protein
MKMPGGEFRYWVLLPYLPTKTTIPKPGKKYFKAKLKKDSYQVDSATTRLNLIALDDQKFTKNKITF